ncbi:MAG TPA: gamma-glutamylcyclotransferase [Leptolyngbyaceae cyanobacterium M65_K2018_010]|nr:gamma-glutamylcyclotransferase [Leptolyngbyaceae cyanobacterium M65_K2018_010]
MDLPPGSLTPSPTEDGYFFYFAYGSCMCPVDLKRSLGESTHAYVVGPAILSGYRLGFFRRSRLRNCGVLDITPNASSSVHGVLYRLPWRLSKALDHREEGYQQETVTVVCGNRLYHGTRTYTVIRKLVTEVAPNDWYSNVVLRGAATCGLPEEYWWHLFHHIHRLQCQEKFADPAIPRAA